MSGINIVDVEASGLHPESYPIEIAVLVDGRMHAWLIAPEPEWTFWDETAEGMHGIAREQLIDTGLDALQVARELNDVLERGNGTLYSDAAPWDGEWIGILFDAVGLQRSFQVLQIERLMTEAQRSAFHEISESLAASGKYRTHRAESDVRMIHAAYRRALGLDGRR